MQQRNEDIVILGAGESGTGAALLAQKKGLKVFVSDAGSIREKYRTVLLHHDIEFEEGNHSESRVLSAGEIVKSPGIPDDTEIVIKAAGKGIPVISEIEFAGRYTRATMICITGSNGKTTTSMLTHHILHRAGLDCHLAGNVGESLAGKVATGDADYYVVEVSSFQLDGMFRFRADIAVLMNITPDHLDRYGDDFNKYARSKFRILHNQEAGDSFIYNQDDPMIRQMLKANLPVSNLIPFSIHDRIEGDGAHVKNEKFIININSNPLTMTLEELALQGKHNLYNSMAAGIAARLLDIRKDTIKECLSDFQHVEHRLEFVASIHGIEFINDSKATNINSTWYALESCRRPIIWIAGGIDKGNDYSLLKDLVRHKVKAIICLGLDNGGIKKAFAGEVQDIIETKSASDAVRVAYHMAKRGDTVLLSPACASFDLFENYEDRGNKFKKAVNSL